MASRKELSSTPRPRPRRRNPRVDSYPTTPTPTAGQCRPSHLKGVVGRVFGEYMFGAGAEWDPRGWPYHEEIPTSKSTFHAYLKFTRHYIFPRELKEEDLNPLWRDPPENDSLETLTHHHRYLKQSHATNRALYAFAHYRGMYKGHLPWFPVGSPEVTQALHLLRGNPNNAFGYCRIKEWAILSEEKNHYC